MKTYAVNEKVFTVRSGSWSVYYTPGVVVKVTPTGMIDINSGTQESPVIRRFNRLGQCTEKFNNRTCIDQAMSFEERVADLARETRLKSAANAIASITACDGVNYKWGVDELACEIARLQGELDAAKALLAAVSPKETSTCHVCGCSPCESPSACRAEAEADNA